MKAEQFYDNWLKTTKFGMHCETAKSVSQTCEVAFLLALGAICFACGLATIQDIAPIRGMWYVGLGIGWLILGIAFVGFAYNFAY